MYQCSDDNEKEFLRLARIRVFREEARARLEPLCRHFSPAAFDKLLDEVALVRYRYEGGATHHDIRKRPS